MVGSVPAGRAVVLDTNIVIDCLKSAPEALACLASLSDVAVSVATRIEVLGGAKTPEADRLARDLLSGWLELPLDDLTVEFAVQLRRLSRMKLADSIILASARRHGRLLLTRDEDDLAGRTGVIVPYTL
jgi:hypothetical protein